MKVRVLRCKQCGESVITTDTTKETCNHCQEQSPSQDFTPNMITGEDDVPI